MTKQEEYEQAVLWRQAIAPKLERAMTELIDAHDACPLSLERVQISAAMEATAQAQRTCLVDLHLANEHLKQIADAQS